MLNLNPLGGDEGFELSDLNPLKPEEGMNDPNRQSLLDTFGQEGLGAGVQQLTRMVTPQTAWGNEFSAGTMMSDFVEFSPIGDVRDFLSAVNPNSGLDPLERSLAVLPVFAFTAAGVSLKHSFEQRMALKTIKEAQGGASLGGETSVRPITNAAMYSTVQGLPIEAAEMTPVGETRIDDLTLEEQAHHRARIAANTEKRRLIDGGARWLETDSIFELAEAVVTEGFEPGTGAPSSGDSYTDMLRLEAAAANLNQLGEAVVRENPDAFNTEEATHEQKVVAGAQYALMAYQNLADRGLLLAESGNLAGNPRTQPLDPLVELPKVLTSLTGHSALQLHRIADVFNTLIQAGVGPDLVASPQTELVAVTIRPDGMDSTTPQSFPNPLAAPSRPRVIIAMNGLLPTQRLVDADGVILGPEAKQWLDDRQHQLDYNAVEPDMTANIMKQIQFALENFTPDDIQRGKNWYRRANATVLALSRQTGGSVQNISALFSGMSMRSAWAPDNLVAGIHTAFRYLLPDMDPSSPEYFAAFEEAITAGGWEVDLLNESSKALRQQYAGDPLGLVRHYADINNFITSTGDNLRGMSMGPAKQNAVFSTLFELPPDLVVRMAKTNNFYAAIADPNHADHVAIDVHHDAGAQGHNYGPEPLGSKGVRKVSFEEIADGTYQFPSGRTFDLALVEQGEAALRRAGLSQAEIAAISDKWRSVPSPVADARYQATARATSAAGKEMGIDETSSAQALAWEPIRRWRDATRKTLYHLKKKNSGITSDEYRAALASNVQNRSIIDHLEGNPQFLKNAVALTQNASSDLSITIPVSTLEALSASRHKVDGTPNPAIIGVRPDGTSEVWVDTSNPEIMQVLRHLEPAPLQVGDWTRMIPKTPAKVTSVMDTLKRISSSLDETGRPSGGQTRVQTGGVYVGHQPGNYQVHEFNSFEEAQAFARELSGLEVALEVTTQQVGVSNSSAARGTITQTDLANIPMDTLHDPAQSPFVKHDWIAITADQNEAQSGISDPAELAAHNARQNEALYKDLVNAIVAQFGVTREQAASMLHHTDGQYGDGTPTERSVVVFGLSYEAAARLGAKYGQEAVATRQGMIYTTGEHAGTYNPYDPSDFQLGEEATQQYFHSSLKVGSPTATVRAAFSNGYDWDTYDTPTGDWDSIMDGQGGTQPAYQVVVALTGAESSLPWWIGDQAWALGKKGKAVSSTAYTSGDLHRPEGTVPIEEHVYSDGAVVGTHRTRMSGGRAPKAVRAYVPYHQALGLDRPTGAEYRGKRTKKAASAHFSQLLGTPGPFVIADEVGLPIGEHTVVRDPSKGVLEWEFERPDGTLEPRGDGFTVFLAEGQLPMIELDAEGFTSDSNLLGPQEVVGEVLAGNQVQLMANDPNLFAEAAAAVEALGYKVIGEITETLAFKPPALPDDTHTIPRVVAEGGGGYSVGKLKPNPNDTVLSFQLKGKYGQEFFITTDNGFMSQDVAEQVRAAFVGFMDANESPDYLQPLHDLGLTLEPHLLSVEGLPGGLHIAHAQVRGLSTVHGWAVTGGRFTDRTVVLSAHQARLESEYGADFMTRMAQLRSRNYFTGETIPGVSPTVRTMVHEVGHSVMGYVEMLANGLTPGQAHFSNAVENIVNRVRKELGRFGETRNLSYYATESNAEFFAEAFTSVALGENVDPSIVQMVSAIVQLANEATPADVIPGEAYYTAVDIDLAFGAAREE